MEELAEQVREANGAPGCNVAVIDRQGHLSTCAVGLADTASGSPLTPATRMPGGSTGKVTAAATALVLAHQGALDLDEPAAKHLGHHDWFDRLPNAADLTARGLATHTAGVPDHTGLPVFSEWLAEGLATQGTGFSPTPEESLAFVLDREPLFPAGERHAYSESGYLVLGLLLEAAAGEPYYDLARRLVQEPLGLTDTLPQDRLDVPGMANGYADSDESILPPTTLDEHGHFRFSPASEFTGGGFVTTATDLARLLHGLATGALPAGDYLPTLLDLHAGWVVGDYVVQYGFGVRSWLTPLGRVIGHGGFFPGYLSTAAHYLEHGVTVATQANAAFSISEYSQRVADLAELVSRPLPTDPRPPDLYPAVTELVGRMLTRR